MMKISSIFYFLADLHARTGWDPDVGAAFKKIGDQFRDAGF